MARKKTSSELDDDIKALEKRLAKKREQQRRATKAEEAAMNASVLNAVRECWDALPDDTRPEWKQMPEYIRQMFVGEGDVKTASGQSE